MHTIFCAFSIKFSRKLFLGFLFLVLFSFSGYTQEDFSEYDELNVEMNVPDLGTIEIPIAIKGQDAYLPLRELFAFVKD